MTEKDNKYKKEYAVKLPGMFVNGEAVVEVCQELGISKQTFYVWLKKYPEFQEAYELGKEASEAWWMKLGRAGAAGKIQIQPATWVFNMKNRFKWTDKTEVSGPDGMPITTINGNMSATEAAKAYAQIIKS